MIKVLTCSVAYGVNSYDRLKVTYMPTATQQISAVENYWDQSKRDILASEYYSMFEDMRRMLSECLRTTSFNHDVMEYLGSKPKFS